MKNLYPCPLYKEKRAECGQNCLSCFSKNTEEHHPKESAGRGVVGAVLPHAAFLQRTAAFSLHVSSSHTLCTCLLTLAFSWEYLWLLRHPIHSLSSQIHPTSQRVFPNMYRHQHLPPREETIANDLLTVLRKLSIQNKTA